MIIEQQVKEALIGTGFAYEIVPIDPTLSDTAAFCRQYGYALEISANTLLLTTKSATKRFCACIVLATTKLDGNRCVKGLMGGRVSFASAEEMVSTTGMEVGAVTPFGLKPEIPIYIDERVMVCEWIILGAGRRSEKIKVAPQAILKLPNTKVISGLAS